MRRVRKATGLRWRSAGFPKDLRGDVRPRNPEETSCRRPTPLPLPLCNRGCATDLFRTRRPGSCCRRRSRSVAGRRRSRRREVQHPVSTPARISSAVVRAPGRTVSVSRTRARRAAIRGLLRVRLGNDSGPVRLMITRKPPKPRPAPAPEPAPAPAPEPARPRRLSLLRPPRQRPCPRRPAGSCPVSSRAPFRSSAATRPGPGPSPSRASAPTVAPTRAWASSRRCLGCHAHVAFRRVGIGH